MAAIQDLALTFCPKMRSVPQRKLKLLIRGFNKFWHKWVVQHNRRVLFWKAFLSSGVRGACPPREILKSYTLADAFSCNLRSIFILLCCPYKSTNLNKPGGKKLNIYSNRFPNDALIINEKKGT